MPEFVKKFIEDNIDYIVDGDWKTVWKNWYVLGNDYYIEEFISCLNKAGINVEKESVKIRLDMLAEEIKNLLSQLLLTRHRITYGDLRAHIKSWLAIPEDVLFKLIDKVAEEQGYSKATNGFYKI